MKLISFTFKTVSFFKVVKLITSMYYVSCGNVVALAIISCRLFISICMYSFYRRLQCWVSVTYSWHAITLYMFVEFPSVLWIIIDQIIAKHMQEFCMQIDRFYSKSAIIKVFHSRAFRRYIYKYLSLTLSKTQYRGHLVSCLLLFLHVQWICCFANDKGIKHVSPLHTSPTSISNRSDMIRELWLPKQRW